MQIICSTTLSFHMDGWIFAKRVKRVKWIWIESFTQFVIWGWTYSENIHILCKDLQESVTMHVIYTLCNNEEIDSLHNRNNVTGLQLSRLVDLRKTLLWRPEGCAFNVAEWNIALEKDIRLFLKLFFQSKNVPKGRAKVIEIKNEDN